MFSLPVVVASWQLDDTHGNDKTKVTLHLGHCHIFPQSSVLSWFSSTNPPCVVIRMFHHKILDLVFTYFEEDGQWGPIDVIEGWPGNWSRIWTWWCPIVNSVPLQLVRFRDISYRARSLTHLHMYLMDFTVLQYSTLMCASNVLDMIKQ